MALGFPCLQYLGLYSTITDTFPSNLYWGVNASFNYREAKGRAQCTLLENTAGIVDTGTTLLYIATGKLFRDSNL